MINYNIVQNILNTLPIGYYLGRSIAVILSNGMDSYFNPAKDEIVIGYQAIESAFQNLERSTYKINAHSEEELIRGILYHEISHVILTPKDFKSYDYHHADQLNIFEDERIETIFKKYYMNTNFKKNVIIFNDYHKGDSPSNALEAFYFIVRFHVGPKKYVDRVARIIRNYRHINAASTGIWDYCSEIVDLWNDVKRDWNNNQDQFQQQKPQQNEQSQDQNNEQSQQNSNGQSQDQNNEQQSQSQQNSSSSDDDSDDENEENNENTQGASNSDSSDESDDTQENGNSNDSQNAESQDDTDNEDSDSEGSDSKSNNDKSEDSDESNESDESNGTDDADSENAENADDSAESESNKTSSKAGKEDVDDFSDNTNESDESEEPDDFESMSDEEIEELIDDLKTNIEEAIKQLISQALNDTVNSYYDPQLSVKLQQIINMKLKEKNKNGSAINSYSGRFNVRAVAQRDDYKWWAQQNREGHIRQYSKVHFNLFIDNSGSFSDNDDNMNTFIQALNRICTKDFDFDVITINTRICEWKDTKSTMFKSGGGTELPLAIGDVIKKHTQPRANNYNIVLFDGDADPQRDNLGNAFRFFDTPNTIIVTDDDNEEYIDSFHKMRKVVTSNYCNKFIDEVLKLLEKAM